jgi:hypothetical protein
MVIVSHHLPSNVIKEKILFFFDDLRSRGNVVQCSVDPARSIAAFQGQYYNLFSGVIELRDGRIQWDDHNVKIEVTASAHQVLVEEKIREFVTNALSK